jgi:hypothetical protein
MAQDGSQGGRRGAGAPAARCAVPSGRAVPSGHRVGVRTGAAVAVVCGMVLAACGADGVLIGAGPDATPQQIVLTATAVGDTGATLAWTSAGSGLAYQLERNGATVGVVETLQATETGLAAGERYCWKVRAYSGFGWQNRSNEACLGTVPDSTEWRIERIAAGRWPAIAVDAQGSLHVCLTGTTGGIDYLKVGPGRTPEVVDADGQGRCSIAVDAAGVVQIAYLSRFGLRYASRGASAATWSAATVDAQALAGNQRFDGPALALGSDGRPRIAYRRLADGGAAPVALATRGSVGWSFDLTGIAGRVGPRSLAIDAAGTARLATTDDLGQAAVVWQRATGGWARLYSQSLAPTRGEGPPLALDAAGAPRMAWWQRDAPTTDTAATLRWAASGASGWRAETVATVGSPGFGVAVAIAGDVARVAALDDRGRLRLYTRDAAGGAWTVETPDPRPEALATVDFAIGTDGQLRVVYDRILDGGVVLASRAP